MTITWHLEKRKLSALTDHPRNPRKLDKNDALQLKESLEKFGVIDKPVITPAGMIIGGHQRKQILKKLAIKEVECWVPNRELTDKEVDELCIRLNRNVGNWDWDGLANNFELVDLLDWGFSLEEFGAVGSALEGVEEGEVEAKGEAKKCGYCPHCATLIFMDQIDWEAQDAKAQAR